MKATFVRCECASGQRKWQAGGIDLLHKSIMVQAGISVYLEEESHSTNYFAAGAVSSGERVICSVRRALYAEMLTKAFFPAGRACYCTMFLAASKWMQFL